MTDHTNIYEALLAAQQEFEPAHKSSRNDHFKSKYADLQACLDAVGPALSKHGITLFWRTEQRGDDWVVVCVLHHAASSSELLCSWPVITTKNDPQGFASGSTYARRYSLMAVTGLAPEDDDGNAASTGSDHKTLEPLLPAVARSKAAALMNPTKAAIERTDVDWLRVWVLDTDTDVRRELAKLLTEDERQYLASLREEGNH